MKKCGVEAMTEEELEKILLIGRITHYDDLKEDNFLVDYYILTGEITLDVEYAKNYLADTFKPHHKELLAE